MKRIYCLLLALCFTGFVVGAQHKKKHKSSVYKSTAHKSGPHRSKKHATAYHHHRYREEAIIENNSIVTGADQTDQYVDYLRGKNIGMVINQTSVIGKNLTSSADSLLKLGIHIKKFFGPEHGFRGNNSAGSKVDDAIDAKTGIPAISLYGKHYKPTKDDLKDIDLMVFDIQDVGARFYTYISTLHYVMEACAENKIELLILDRPNPNGHIVDGPVLDTAFHSFVGMHPVPVAHGVTVGEYAQMINGEGWLANKAQCKLKIIKVAGYKHNMTYILPVNPSPNLNTRQSILLYPSICFFEGTVMSLGRGTDFPFTIVGHPGFKGTYKFTFTPESIAGVSDNPPLKDRLCYGIDLRDYDMTRLIKSGKINLNWLILLYKNYPDQTHFFNAYFNKLAGNDVLQEQIKQHLTESQIRRTWEPALSNFKQTRQKYLLYE